MVPRISVIVTTQYRKTYLRQAVASILRQTLARPEYEVVVAKGFSDSGLEAYLDAEDVRTVTAQVPLMGELIARGVTLSHGDVLCFLDDDDLFLPNKLERVGGWFDSDPELDFVHHGYTVVDERGEEMGTSTFRSSQRQALREVGPLRLRSTELLARLRSLPPTGIDFNSSTMCVRRRVVEPRLEVLRQLPPILDSFLFHAALLSGRHMALQPESLAGYRVHGSNSSLSQARDLIPSLYAWSRSTLPGYREISRMAEREGSPDEAGALLAFQEFYGAFRSPRPSRGEMWRRWKELRRWTSTYTYHAEPPLRAAAWAFLVSPRMAQRAYARSKWKEQQAAVGASPGI